MNKDMGPLPLVHERHVPVEQARRELLGFVLDWEERHGLTLAERLALLAEESNRALWMAVRSERRQDEERNRAEADHE